MNQINYQKILDEKLSALQNVSEVPSLLLHSCCAPCSSYCLSYLAEYFHITVFYFNPNISSPQEYAKRVEEQKRLLDQMPFRHPVSFLCGRYDPEEFFAMAKGMEDCPEGGERCFLCYQMRLEETAQYASQHSFDFFTTTLSVSPYKNATWLNEIGESCGERYQVPYLYSDFKKKGGYAKSIEYSHQYQLYRQDFCGCIYSQIEREKQKQRKNKESEDDHEVVGSTD